MPATETNRDEIEQQKRKEYLGFVDKFYNETAMKKTDNEHAIQRQIHIDVPRTNPDVFLYQDKKIQIVRCARILTNARHWNVSCTYGPYDILPVDTCKA